MTDGVDHPWDDDSFDLTGTEPWLSTEEVLEDADITYDPDPKLISALTPAIGTRFCTRKVRGAEH